MAREDEYWIDKMVIQPVINGGGEEPAFWVVGLRLRIQEPNPDPLLQKPGRNQGSGCNPPHRAGTEIRFARADSLA